MSMLVVTDRQMAEFLPGGRYYAVQDQALRDRLAHSHLTNLVAEQYFADLDFSLFKRRSCSLYHHATLAMLKRNRSVTWLMQKPAEEREQLLRKVSKKAQHLRQKHQQEEQNVLHQMQILMEQRWQEMEQAAPRKRKREEGIRADLQPHAGPCQSLADVEQMVSKYNTNGGLRRAARAELLFQKLILGKTDSCLKVTGNPLQLINRLRQFFQGPALTSLPLLHRVPRNRAVAVLSS